MAISRIKPSGSRSNRTPGFVSASNVTATAISIIKETGANVYSNAKAGWNESINSSHRHVGTFYRFVYSNHTPLGSSSSDFPASLSSPQPSASSERPRMPKLNMKPIKETAPKTPNATASPLGCNLAVRENSPPERNGPTARPAAERVCARPFKAPRTAWLGAEFVT